MTSIVEDGRLYPRKVAVQSVTAGLDHVLVTWRDGRLSPYHLLWLRDNCRCRQCVHPDTLEQVFEVADLPATLPVPECDIDENGDMNVMWWDGHHSLYSAGWLRAFAYDEVSRAERAECAHSTDSSRGHGRDLVLGTDPAAVPRFAFDDVMESDACLLEWILALQAYGLTQVRDVPRVLDHVGLLGARIARVRDSEFGKIFDVRCEPVPGSNANIDLALRPHTDLPTREAPPGWQLLHCLENSASGGESVFVDGFVLAEALRAESPEDFGMLSSQPLPFATKSKEIDYRFRQPVILLDVLGAVVEIRIANFLRDPFDAAPEEMMALYRAYRTWLLMSREPRFQLVCRLQPGEAWCFDNRRYLHGREAFDATSGARHFQGVYIDRDDWLSRLRMLQRHVTIE